MSAFHNNTLIGSSNQGYTISRSVRLRNSATGYFTRTAGTPTSQNVWTVSMWVKMGNMVTGATASGGFFGANQAGNPNESIKWDGTTTSIYYQAATAGGTNNLTRFLVRNFRDPSAWYHLVFQKNAAANSGTGCFLAWVNGVAVSSYTGGYTGTQAAVPDYINTTGSTFNIGAIGSANSLDAYLAEVNFVDGQALTPSSFGETDAVTGVWKPKKYTGTYGNNGFYLNFSDNSAATAAAIGKDYSGNGNNFTPSAGISVTAGSTYDSMLDVPTPYADGGNGRGNYCVLNPITGSATLSNGNLVYTSATGAYYATIGTVGVSSGKWYWEVTANGAGQDIGICGLTNRGQQGVYVGSTSDSYGYYSGSGNKYNNGSASAYGATYTTNDVIGVALDLDAGTIVFYKNNASQGTAFSGLSGTFLPMASNDLSNAGAGTFNFGQRPFTYTPPSGYSALNTQNLPDSTIKNGANYMAATTYTGTGAVRSIDNSVNGVSMQPDLVWVKNRNSTQSHIWTDVLRGVTKQLYSNVTSAEGSDTNSVTAFNSNGFSLGTDAGGIGVNTNTNTYVAWQWNAGGSTVTNTSGTISAQVRANATAGFSVVTCTFGNGSIGHGLGVAPKMIIGKGRGPTTGNWIVFHSGLANMTDKYLNLNGTAAVATLGTAVSAPTSTLFYGNGGYLPNAESAVFYCFAAVAGYSAFGSYTGNGSADGPFVYTGFRPRWIMIKRTDAVANWLVLDTSRNTYNVTDAMLNPNLSDAETTGVAGTNNWDVLSNGFKVRGTGALTNASAGTYIYAAFAENPFKLSLAR